MAKTLYDVEAGDEVAQQVGASDNWTLYQVKEINQQKDVLVLVDGRQFRRKDGTPYGRGSAKEVDGIVPVTDAIRQAIHRRALIVALAAISYRDWQQLPLPALQEIYVIYKTSKPNV